MATSNKPLTAVCGAKIRVTPNRIARAAAAGPKELEKLLNRTFCRNHPVPGRRRCYLHGGYSTGPITREGRATIALNLKGASNKGFPHPVHSAPGTRQNVLKRNAEIRQLVAERRNRFGLSGATIAQGDALMK